MSGQVHDVGSVVDFWPSSKPFTDPDYAGVVLVVVKRSNWIITTELRAVRFIDGRYVVDPPEENR